ncbi:MAG: alpha/beta hydrolase [Gemmataceae bacterium]|nr:alpha/beta hydrolase [Gemmataceae bacterium]
MRPCRVLPVSLALSAAVLVGLAPPAFPQPDGKGPQPVEFVSADRVELKGHFYPGSKGRNSPTVMLLHALGEDCKKAEWISLAKALNKAGYAVLRFDFRGHGDSTTVQPGKPHPNPAVAERGFWDEKDNAYNIKGYKTTGGTRPTTIDHKYFTPAYYRVLANDLVAAKAFLDERNDQNECNSGHLIVLGAKEGATIGAIWLNGEFHRFKVVKPLSATLAKLDVQNPEGNNVAAAVWLSITSGFSSKQGTQQVNVASTLYKAGAENKVPMTFFYAKGDEKALKTAKDCEKRLRLNKTDYTMTAAVEVKGGEKFSGSALLSKTLGTEAAIVRYLDNVMKERRGSWKSRNAMTDAYAWQWQLSGRVVQQPAKARGNLMFNSFAAFMMR